MQTTHKKQNEPMKKMITWLRESNRWKHLVGGCMIGLASSDAWCATLAGVGVASALEYKDKAWGGQMGLD